MQTRNPAADAQARPAAAACGTGLSPASARRRTATHRSNSRAGSRSRTRARSRPRVWHRRRRSSLARRRRRHTTSTSAAAARCMPKACRLMPVMSVSRKKPPASASDSRLEIVMVRRSLDAAKAIRAGNSSSLIASVSMHHTSSTQLTFAPSRYAAQACRSVSARTLLGKPELAKRRAPAAAGALYRSVDAHLLQLGRNRVELGVQLGAEAVDDGDDRDRDAGGDKAVFDRGGAELSFTKRTNRFFIRLPRLHFTCRPIPAVGSHWVSM